MNIIEWKQDKIKGILSTFDRIIIKGITFLAFNYSKTIYVGNLSNKLEINELESFIKELN